MGEKLADLLWAIWYRLERLYYWVTDPVRMFRHHHWHVLRMDDMALGAEDATGIPVTAWRYGCRLCERVFFDITETAWEQLDRGHSSGEVFGWMRDRMEVRGE